MRRGWVLVGVAVAASTLVGCTGDGSKAERTISYNSAITIAAPPKHAEPAIDRAQATLMVRNSSYWPQFLVQSTANEKYTPDGDLELKLGTITIRKGARDLVQPWTERLAWYYETSQVIADVSMCPMLPFSPGPVPEGPQHLVYAVDATGVGDGITFRGDGMSCGHLVEAQTWPLTHLWSAQWRLRTETPASRPQSVNIVVTPPECSTGEATTAFIDSLPDSRIEIYEVPYGRAGCGVRAEQYRTVNLRSATSTVKKPVFGWIRLHGADSIEPALPS